jgi:tyrosinase
LSRADLEFRGVDHSGPSFEARVFFQNPRADQATAQNEAEGYAGSFHIFGHGGCFGELGHCDVGETPRGVYDRRPPHPLTPYFKKVVVTEALQRVMQTADGDKLTVTVVPVVPENPASRVKVDDPLKFESVSLITYQDPAAAGIPLPA